MVRGKPLAVYSIQIRNPDVIHYTALSPDAYWKLFRSLDKTIAERVQLKGPKELTTSSDVVSLVKTLKRLLSVRRSVRCHGLVIEMLGRETDFHGYDDLCEGLYLALKEKDVVAPWCIIIAVSEHKILNKSVFLEWKLIPICKDRSVGLILVSDDEKFRPTILCRGNLPDRRELPFLKSVSPDSGEEKAAKPLTTEEIEAEFLQIFGHFQVGYNGSQFHMPAIASVKKLTKNTVFVKQLSGDVARMLESSDFAVIPFGIAGGGINDLAIAVVEGATNKIVDPLSIAGLTRPSVLILCDYICQLYPLEKAVRELREGGCQHIAVVGVASYSDAHDLSGANCLSYIETNHRATPGTNPLLCRFCLQDTEVIRGDHFEEYARKIEKFDSMTFWELIRQDKEFYRVGHWASKVTPNHYLFTIVAKPIFRRHGYGLALRLRNILESGKIHSSWVNKIVCIDEKESTALSLALAEVLGLYEKDVVRIPRQYFASIAGKQLDPELTKYIETKYHEDDLKRRNVLIVDQAAHHFKTMSALRDICEYYECTVMAFTVFLDRTDTALSLGEYLYNSNYFALYSWPVPPRRGHECPCAKELT